MRAAAPSAGPVEVVPVRSRAERDAFIKVPFAVYGAGDNWVPPLIVERREHLDEAKNPYFRHGEAALWIARRDGRDVGRISAQVCQLHLARYGDATGQFGFIEAVDDPAVFAALFNAAESWLRARGMARVRGPFSFSINEETGLLIDGFDTPPAVMMGHAKPYYAQRIEQAGYAKARDVIAYDYPTGIELPRAAAATLERVRASGELTIRPIRKAALAEDLAIIRDIFNDAWQDNWGFVPLTEEEIAALGRNLKPLIAEGYVAIASYRGEPAAMAVTLPDINEWIADLDGRLLPFGWAKLLWRLKSAPPRSIRLPLMGVRKTHQSTAVGAALALGVIDAIRSYHFSRGTRRGELSWILEDNAPMRRMIEWLGAKPYKTYRIYEKML